MIIVAKRNTDIKSYSLHGLWYESLYLLEPGPCATTVITGEFTDEFKKKTCLVSRFKTRKTCLNKHLF